MAVGKLVVAAAVAMFTALSVQSEEDVQALLRQKDQALLDAIAPGDRAAWERMISQDFFYADENNRIINRQQFLKELEPLPKGTSGSIVITSYELHRDADTAIVVHRDDETEHYFGSELHAQYLMTETWQLKGGEWRLRDVHCAAVPVDVSTIALTQAQMDELVGSYAAGSLTYVIKKEVDRLMGGQPGHKETELKAETRDVLIVIGQPRSRKVFFRDAAGNVTGFSDRRENRDLLWTRRK